jgi:hypothetical protein
MKKAGIIPAAFAKRLEDIFCIKIQQTPQQDVCGAAPGCKI